MTPATNCHLVFDVAFACLDGGARIDLVYAVDIC
jgi:hypothetical protein